jgi:glycogen synthase
MPEFIKPGHNGALLSKDDPLELARLIANTLADDDLYQSCRAAIPDVLAHFSWDRAAGDALSAIRQTLAG